MNETESKGETSKEEIPKYPLGGWLLPIWKPRDPNYCEHGCPICTKARAGSNFFQLIQKIESMLVGKKGCWWGRVRYKNTGKLPNEK